MTGVHRLQLAERLCLYGIGAILLVLLFRLFDSFSLDESGMIYVLSLPAKGAFEEYTRNLPMLSLYEAFMWIWLRLVGTTEVMARLPSIVFFLATLVTVYRIARSRLERKQALLTCLIATATPQIQVFATTARPYMMTILFCALSMQQFTKWQEKSGVKNLVNAGAWLAVSIFTKIFAATQLAMIAPLVWFMGKREDRFKNMMAVMILPAIAVAVQLPLVIHFQKHAHMHMFTRAPAGLDHFRHLVLEPTFTVEVWGAIAALLILRLLNRQRDRFKNWKFFWALGFMALTTPVFIGLATWATGTFLLSEKYAVAAYLPAILLAGFLATTATQLKFAFPFICLHLGFVGALSAASLPAEKENWRRAFQIARNMQSERAPTLLLHTGFFESQFKDFEGSGFLLSPALVYNVPGPILAVPAYPMDEMIPWIEKNIRPLVNATGKKPILFISKRPMSQKKALLIAEMLGWGITGIEFDQTQVWWIFPLPLI